MSDEELPQEEAPSSPPEVVQVPTDTPVRELEPLTLFAPNVGDPVATKDFRPHGTFVFDNEEKREDGHGNFQHPAQSEPRHPSLPREPQPYEKSAGVATKQIDEEGSTETEGSSETPDPSSSQPSLPFDQ